MNDPAPHTPAAPRGDEPAGRPHDIDVYLRAVDDELLALPWKARREAISDLAQHLRECPAVIERQAPREYAAALLDEYPPDRRDLPGGIRSPLWPTPLEWLESWIRGVAAVWVLVIAIATGTSLVDAVVSGAELPSPEDLLGSVYPAPGFRGATRDGLLLALPISWLVGQYLTVVALRRKLARRHLRRLTYLALGVLCAIYATGLAVS